MKTVFSVLAGLAMVTGFLALALKEAQTAAEVHQVQAQARADMQEVKKCIEDLTVLAMKAKLDWVSVSWYAKGLKNPHHLTAASRTFPKGKRLHLQTEKGKRAWVRINDFGPEAWTGHSLDLSLGAANALGITRAGVARVRILEVQ